MNVMNPLDMKLSHGLSTYHHHHLSIQSSSPLRPEIHPLKSQNSPLSPRISPFKPQISPLKPQISPLRP